MKPGYRKKTKAPTLNVDSTGFINLNQGAELVRELGTRQEFYEIEPARVTKVLSNPYDPDTRTISLKKELKNISIGKIPVMVKSDFCMLKNETNKNAIDEECKHDLGGYFIINGNEKVIVGQEKITPNKLLVFQHNP